MFLCHCRRSKVGGMSFSKLISQAFPRPLPQPPLVFPALSLALIFARAPLSERLEQAQSCTTFQNNTKLKNFPALAQYTSGLGFKVKTQDAELFLHLKQHREQHRTKNSPKTATNCAQITHKTQRQPHTKVSEVYFHIHNFILAF